MTTQLDMIRGRSNVVTLTNNSGGGLVAGDVCVQDTSADEKVTTTTSAASVLKVFIAAETIASGAAGKFYESGYCPLVNVNASVTRGRFLFTHTVAKQAAENATYGAGAFGKILKSGTTPSAIIYSATAQVAGSGTIGGSSGSTDNAVIRADGTGGVTVQSSLMTVDDSGTPNIPTGQTYNINGSPHTHAGGGSTIFESAFGSPPGSPTDGDDWHITDSRLMAHRASSAWSYYWGTRQVHVVPTTSWVNQGSATLTDTGDLTLFCPAVNADNLRGRVYTAPSLNYTIDVIMIPAFKPATDTFAAYIGWSNGTAFVTFGIGNTNASGGPYMEVIKWTNSTTFSAAYAGSTSAEPFIRWVTKPIYLRIQEDGSNRTCSYSFDEGRNYIQFHQVGRTDFLTATQVGFFVFNHHASLTNSQVILDWTVT